MYNVSNELLRIKFGSIQQDQQFKEPIAWKSYKILDDKVCFSTEKILCSYRVENGELGLSWYNSSIRKFLNKYLLNLMFDNNEASLLLLQNNDAFKDCKLVFIRSDLFHKTTFDTVDSSESDLITLPFFTRYFHFDGSMYQSNFPDNNHYKDEVLTVKSTKFAAEYFYTPDTVLHKLLEHEARANNDMYKFNCKFMLADSAIINDLPSLLVSHFCLSVNKPLSDIVDFWRMCYSSSFGGNRNMIRIRPCIMLSRESVEKYCIE